MNCNKVYFFHFPIDIYIFPVYATHMINMQPKQSLMNEHRISENSIKIESKLARWRLWGKKMSTLREIHKEIDPVIEARIKAEEFLAHKQHEKQGFVFDLDKYEGAHIYNLGTLKGTDLMKEKEKSV